MSDERSGGRVSAPITRHEALRLPDGGAATVSGDLARPADWSAQTPVLILAHGAGNDMTNPLLAAVADGLALRGIACVRFNFPYKERGGKAPDRTPVLEACYRAVIADVRERFAPQHLFLGGKSLGGRMASHLAAAGEPADGLVLLGYPLHPPNQTDKLRDAHLPRIGMPMLFFAGTRDPLCNLDLLKRALGALRAPSRLHVFPDGDHSFKVPKRSGRTQAEVFAEIVAQAATWLRSCLAADGVT
jgi:hypothetical protein